MIKLDLSVTEKFDHLKAPPTHALCYWRALHYHPTNTHAGPSLKVHYEYGTLDGDGKFVRSPWTAAIDVRLPDANVIHQEIANEMLGHLFEPGRVPHPADPRQSIPVPAKRAGECRLHDIDAICAAVFPELKGEVIPDAAY
jgi:hypothetical protein